MKTKILIVDDIRENIVALKAILAGNDLDVFDASDADTALNLVIENEFALAILDVHMPSMSGFDLARLIRGVERSRHLPIIFVTAQDKGASIEFEGYETGAVDLLFKPLDPHVVRSKVRVFAQLDRQSRELQEQIRIASQLKEQAEDANLTKGRFLANMSHEIRTPLGAVLGFSELLASDDLNVGERRKLVSSLKRNGELLKRVIDDVLDLSKIEAQKLELTPTVFDLRELINDLELTLGHRAREKGIAFSCVLDKNLDGHFESDPMRVKQVLLNVIGNAVKFTEKGSVRVEGKFDGDTVIFTVRDTGIGLTLEQRQRLFQPFMQADASTSKKFGGSGLGLVISRQLAHLLGGSVELTHCEESKGCEFTVSFKMKRVASPGPRPAAEANVVSLGKNLNGRRILIVDDVVDNRELMELFLQSTGINIDMAESGEQALELVRVSDPYDAILMDIQMPGMDGYATTESIRAGGYRGPIVALTAHAMKSELEQCLRSGCNDVLTKPVGRMELLRRLSSILAN